MILNYTDFIIENHNYNLILESDIKYSEDVKNILKNIDNKIADQLLKMEDNDYGTKINYFDLSDNEGYLSFSTENFIDKLKEEEENTEFVMFRGRNGGWLKHKDVNNFLFNELNYTPEGDPYQPQPDEVGEVVDKAVSEESGKTWLYVIFSGNKSKKGVYNENKIEYIDKNVFIWGDESRQQMKIGKTIKKLLDKVNFNYDENDITEFTNLFKSAIKQKIYKFKFFEVVNGSDIAEYYDVNNYYDSDSGELGNSCMKSVDDEFFDIYVLNPQKVSLAILKHPERSSKITGRALVWKLDSGEFFMDRIYTAYESDVYLFKEFAKYKKWNVKAINDSSIPESVISPTGDIKPISNIQVSIEDHDYYYYPYMDSLKYYSPEKNVLTTRNLSNQGYDQTILLEETEGSYIYPP